MAFEPEVLKKIIALQKAHEAAGGVDYGKLSLDALNRATMAEKAKMSPEAISAEEARREQINAAEDARLKAQGDAP